MNNPLMKTFDGPLGTIPFYDIETEHFLPAITEGIKDAESAIKSITDNKTKPTFGNTILALELSGQKLGSAINTYYHLFGSEFNQEFKDLSDKISPIIAEFENNIYFKQNLTNTIILIIGDTGFIGPNLIERFLKQNNELDMSRNKRLQMALCCVWY